MRNGSALAKRCYFLYFLTYIGTTRALKYVTYEIYYKIHESYDSEKVIEYVMHRSCTFFLVRFFISKFINELIKNFWRIIWISAPTSYATVIFQFVCISSNSQTADRILLLQSSRSFAGRLLCLLSFFLSFSLFKAGDSFRPRRSLHEIPIVSKIKCCKQEFLELRLRHNIHVISCEIFNNNNDSYF